VQQQVVSVLQSAAGVECALLCVRHTYALAAYLAAELCIAGLLLQPVSPKHAVSEQIC
jgi:hypothetical protein